MARVAALCLVLAFGAIQYGGALPADGAYGSHSLQQDLDDFRSLLPFEKVKMLVFQYLNSDEEFQDFVQYVMSDETKDLILQVENSKTVHEILHYLHEAGTDVYQLLNKLHDFFGMEAYKPSVVRYNYRISGGLRGFFEDLDKMVPHEELKAMYQEKMKSSSEFKKFVNYVKERAQKVADEVSHIHHVRELYNYLKNKNVDVQKFLDFVNGFFGIHVNPLRASSSSLQDDFKDFGSLLPFEKVKMLVFQYLNSDAEFQDFVQYIMSDGTQDMILEIENSESVHEILHYLHEAGTDVYKFLNKLHEFFGMEAYKPNLHRYSYGITGGLRGFFEDLEQLVPHEELKAMYQEKMRSSSEFKKFINYVKERAQKVADEVSHIHHVRELYNYLKSMNVDVQKFLDFVNGFFGIHVNPLRAPSSSLQDDLNDFRSLLPLGKVKMLVFEYLNSDAEFQDFVQYVMSDETKDLILQVENSKTVHEILHYLHEAGTDVYKLLNQLHDFFGMEAYKPSLHRHNNRISGGLRGFFEELDQMVPHEKLRAMYQEKMKSSSEFQKFVNYVKERAQKVADEVSHIHHVRELYNYLKNKNVDVQKFLDFVNGFFGIHVNPLRAPSSSLQDDFNDFGSLLPVEQVEMLVYKYYYSDNEFQDFVQYVMSDETKELILQVENSKSVHELLRYLHEAGTHVYEELNKLHEFFGMEAYKPSLHRYSYGITGGLRGFFEDLDKLIPHDKLRAMYQEKMKSSSEFKKFINYVKERAQKVADEVSHIHHVRELYNYLKSKNVDVQKFLDFVNGFFGINSYFSAYSL